MTEFPGYLDELLFNTGKSSILVTYVDILLNAWGQSFLITWMYVYCSVKKAIVPSWCSVDILTTACWQSILVTWKGCSVTQGLQGLLCYTGHAWSALWQSVLVTKTDCSVIQYRECMPYALSYYEFMTGDVESISVFLTGNWTCEMRQRSIRKGTEFFGGTVI